MKAGNGVVAMGTSDHRTLAVGMKTLRRTGTGSGAVSRQQSPDQCQVLAKTNQRQKAVIADGNHRLHGMMKAGGDNIDAYVITKARPAMIVQLTLEANTVSGRSPSYGERLAHAIWLCQHGLAQRDAAHAVRVDLTALRSALGHRDRVGGWAVSPDVRRRYTERGLTDEEVRLALSSPDSAERSSFCGYRLLRRGRALLLVQSQARQLISVQLAGVARPSAPLNGGRA